MHQVLSVVLTGVLAAAAWSDYRSRRIPNALTMSGLAAALVLRAFLGAPMLIDGLIGTLLAFVLTLPFLMLGVMGGVGHFLFTAAFRDAPASILSPMNYLQLLWVALLGWLVFDHIPDAPSLVGMAVIGASGVMVALKSRQPTEEAA